MSSVSPSRASGLVLSCPDCAVPEKLSPRERYFCSFKHWYFYFGLYDSFVVWMIGPLRLTDLGLSPSGSCCQRMQI